MRDTIDMANETLDKMAPDDYCRESYWTATDEELKSFAALVRADERKETDRLRALCDELLSELYVYRASKYLKDTTYAIRAWGQA